LREDVCTDSFELKVPRANGREALASSCVNYLIPRCPDWLKYLPTNLFIDIGVPDRSLGFKVQFNGAGENTKSTTLLKRKFMLLFHHSEPDHQHQNPVEGTSKK
jgi:hypothetical protein